MNTFKNTKEIFQALTNGERLISQDEKFELFFNEDNELIFYDRVNKMEFSCTCVPNHTKWKVKQKTVNINGFEVPEPIRNKDLVRPDKVYYIPWINNDNYYLITSLSIINDNSDFCLEKGLLHETKENAILHAKALLSFTNIN